LARAAGINPFGCPLNIVYSFKFIFHFLNNSDKYKNLFWLLNLFKTIAEHFVCYILSLGN
jgi:hypothetical protein